jgi:rhodanese-related sulfurtransferase
MLSALLSLSLAAYAGVPTPAAVPEIELAELKTLVAAHQVVLVDANGTESFKQGHIPGAIDFAAHQSDLASVLPAQKDALIVAYCGGPMCNAWEKAATAVTGLGYTDLKHFKGGISGWKDAQGPVEAVH